MSELLPCPFCGSNKVEVRDSKFWTGMRYSILSTSLTHICDKEKRWPIVITTTGKTIEEAIEKWNKRT